MERGMDETTDEHAPPTPRIRLRVVLGLVAFLALGAFVARDPPHYRDPAFLAQVDRRYRKIQNDHAIAMYDRTVEELSRLNVPFPMNDDLIAVDEGIFDFEVADEDVDLSFWSGKPAPS